MEKYFIIHTPNGSSYNLIDINGTIYIGGNKYYCATVGIRNNGDDLFINSGKQCVLYNKFPSEIRIGTDLIYAMLYYLKHEYNTCELTFNDKSGDRVRGSIPVYYLAFLQKTWYEFEFNAEIVNSLDKEIYEKNKLNFNSNEFKENIRLTYYKILINTLKDENIIKKFLQLYDSSSTISEFFDNVKQNMLLGKIDFVKDVKPWLNTFIKDLMGFKIILDDMSIKWKINCDKIHFKNEYTLTKLSENPLPKWKNRYMDIKKKAFYEQQGGERKSLSERERELFKNENWIGWSRVNNKEYKKKDRRYLSTLRRYFLNN